MELSVFPDTNIFLHFRPLEEVDLPDIFDVESVILVIAPEVLKELDRLKWDHSREGIRKRAGRSAQRILKWVTDGTPIRPGVTVQRGHSASEGLLEKFDLDRRSGDDLIIGSMLAERDRSNIDCILLTNDAGPALRANTLGIDVHGLEDSLRLPDAPDEQGKEILRLKSELAELRGRAPDLRVLFDDGFDGIQVMLPAQLDFDESAALAEANKLVTSAKEDAHQKRESSRGIAVDPDKPSSLARLASAMWQVSEEEEERFNKEIEKYPAKFVEYARSRNIVDNRNRRSIRCTFQLTNSGTAIAEDIILDLWLPENLYWLQVDEARRLPTPPKLPNLPRPLVAMAGMKDLVLPPQQWEPIPSPGMDPAPRVSGPFYDDRHLSWEIEDLHHNSHWVLGPVLAVFRTPSDVSSFQVETVIRERHSPKMIEGILLVKVEWEARGGG